MYERARRRRRLGTLAPACIVAVAYVDPGNFGVNVTAGATYRYALVWVVVLASVMAAVIQYLAAKLGIATGRSLAENCRGRYGTRLRVALWLQAELAVVMTDLAEIVGGAIALRMLTGVPLLVGAVVVAGFSALVLVVRVRGRQGFEPVVLGLLGAILVALAYQVWVSHVEVGALGAGLVPAADLPEGAVLLAAGVIGATVMPHALHLHSALSHAGPGRSMDPGGSGMVRVRAAHEAGRASRSTGRSIVVAMTVAGLANIAIMVVSAALPGGSGQTLELARASFTEVLGRTAGVMFAVALLASGLASTVVGVYTGQVVMAGFLRRPVSMWVRRGAATVPPLLILMAGMDPTRALVLSQVVLAFTLPGTLVPLVLFTSRRAVMGALVNRAGTTVVAITITAFITALDAYLLHVALR